MYNHYLSEISSSNISSYANLDFKKSSSKAMIKISSFNEECQPVASIEIPKVELEKIMDVGNRYIQQNIQKENYYIKALQNLIKKNNFLDLSLQLAENQITDEEYEQEIDDFPEKYIINVGAMTNTQELLTIVDIVKKLGVQLYNEEVAEIFGFRTEDIERAAYDLLD